MKKTSKIGLSQILNSNQIKLIAIIAMTIDHIAWLVFPGFAQEPLPVFLHIIGRLTCPIMCYFIAEGYHYTKNINKYTFRLFLFAFISHFAYVFASQGFVDWKSFIPFYYGDFLNQTSVMWSLAWGLVMLRVIYTSKIKGNLLKVVLLALICVVSFPADWSCVAALCILAIGMNRGNFKAQMLYMIFFVCTYTAVYAMSLSILYGFIQLGVVLSIPILKMYNGKRGENPKINKAVKWLFYIYYPLHLFIIGLVQYITKM